jgi:capsular polysaccharide export protein
MSFIEKAKGMKCLLLGARLDGRKLFVESLGAEIVDENAHPRDYDGVIVVGGALARLHRSRLENKQVFRIEAGYLRSFLMDRSDSKFDKALCFFVDELNDHYFCNSPSTIENLLQNFTVNKQQEQQARRFINQILQNKITKYNNQSEEYLLPKGPSVLVVEQSMKDQAILYGNGSEQSFKRMLECALDENPAHKIIIKIHPDTLDGKRATLANSYYGAVKENDRIIKITQKVNPYTLLQQVEKTYAFSSMLGIESLLAGVETHIFGMPCYAGWGLTKDRSIEFNKDFIPVAGRRTTKRTIEELVYIIYYEYTRYIDYNGNHSTPENFLNEMIKLKAEYNNV